MEEEQGARNGKPQGIKSSGNKQHFFTIDFNFGLAAATFKQAICVREQAQCQLTFCFELQSTSESTKGHKSCALQMVLRSKVQI